MYSKSCPRVLDRPILFFGLEIEDLAAILSIACAILVLVSPLLAVPVGIALFLAVRKLKEGKPSGYLFHLAYQLGLIGLLRRAMKVRHLVPIPLALRGRRLIRLSPATGSTFIRSWGRCDRRLRSGLRTYIWFYIADPRLRSPRAPGSLLPGSWICQARPLAFP